MKRFQNLLIALTGSPADQAALRWGRLIAERAGSTLIQALIVDPEPADWLPEYPPAGGDERWKECVREATESLQEAFAGLPGLTLRTKAAVGAPLPTILHELVDGDCDLVVLGVADEAERRLAEKLARKSPASVLAVPASAVDSLRSILVPTDFSEPSSLAFEVAAALAQSFEAQRITCLHSYRINDRELRSGLTRESLRDSYHESAAGHLSRFLEEHSLSDQPFDSVVREAPVPSTAIVEELASGSHDLLVIATRGRSSLARALLGSNSADVIRQATTPVFAVKAKGEGLGLLRSLLGSTHSETAAPDRPS